MSIGSPFAPTADPHQAEVALVVRAQAGDTAAFDSLMRTHRERVWGVIYNLIGQADDAADITQDVFIKAFTNIQRYSFRSSFFTWLYRIAVNEALNHQRRHRLKRALMLDKFSSAEAANSVLENALAPGGQGALQNELQAQLTRAIQRLSPDHRTVVVLAEIEALPLREVAEILKVSEGTVKSRLHYAKKELQTILKPYISS